MPKISKVETYVFTQVDSPLFRSQVCHQLAMYDEFYEGRFVSWFKPGFAETAVKITTEDGVYGLGMIGGNKAALAELVKTILTPLLLGRDALEIEKNWDILYRATVQIGRRGAILNAISAVDIALWDILGKYARLPVYALLGGKVKDKLKTYVSGIPREEHRQMGFSAVKIPMSCGPHQGREGMRANLARVEEARKLMGNEAELMLEAYLSWDEIYTVQMANLLKDYRIKWIEEPLMPDFYEGYARLKDKLNSLGIMLSGGEHEFSRFGFKRMIDLNCVDILQPDIWRAGGISETKKIMAMASAVNMNLIPHLNGAPVYHLAINSTNTPLVEFHYRGQVPSIFIDDSSFKEGWITLGQSPGLGYDLNPELLEYAAVVS